MATTRRASTTRTAASGTARTRKAAPAPAARTRKAAPAKAPAKAPARKSASDVTVYATKAPTDYHKAFAKWITTEVGYDPAQASSLRMAFLMGVSIATAARPAFMNSDYLEEWREKTGFAKRGPKAQDEAPARGRRSKAEPEEDFEEDDSAEFEEDDEELEEDDSEEDDEDFEDDDEESDEDEDDSEDFEEDEEEDAPPARTRRTSGRSSGRTPAKRTPAKKAAPAARGRRSSKAKDDDFLF